MIFFVFLLSPIILLGELHVILESSRIYRGITRANQSEYWFSGKNVYRKRGNAITITRKDLELSWNIDLSTNTYWEEKIVKEKKLKKEKEDTRALGFQYEPSFDWTIREPGEKKEIDGSMCFAITVEGDDDFAESITRIWLSPDSPLEDLRPINDILTNSMYNQGESEIVQKILKKYPKAQWVSCEHTIDNPIAPIIRSVITLKKVEIAAAPANIFDLPPGLEKEKNKK